MFAVFTAARRARANFSWRDLILIAGGLFLVWKATKEIHHKVDPDRATTKVRLAGARGD